MEIVGKVAATIQNVLGPEAAVEIRCQFIILVVEIRCQFIILGNPVSVHHSSWKSGVSSSFLPEKIN